MNRKLIIFLLTAGVIIGVIAAVLICKDNGSKESEMGPEAVVEAFSRAVAAGDLEKAADLCDTVCMAAYLNRYQEAWESLHKKDSCVLGIASSILSDAQIRIEDTEKKDGHRIVRYTIETAGHTKTKTATLKKGEKGWIVEEITDEI